MKAKVVQTPEQEVPTEILAQAIEDVAKGMRKLMTTRLTKRAILLMIRDYSGVGMAEAERVIDSIENLDKRYLKKASK